MEQSSPHYAIIKFNIDVFPMMPDGSVHPVKLPQSELESFDLASTGVFTVIGVNKEDCMNKILEAMKQIKYE